MLRKCCNFRLLFASKNMYSRCLEIPINLSQNFSRKKHRKHAAHWLLLKWRNQLSNVFCRHLFKVKKNVKFMIFLSIFQSKFQLTYFKTNILKGCNFISFLKLQKKNPLKHKQIGSQRDLASRRPTTAAHTGRRSVSFTLKTK